MNIKTIIASIATSIVVVVGAFGIYHPTTVVTQNSNPIVRGASSDFSNVPYINVNGVTEWYSSMAMRQGNGTTTVCSFPAPTASSTIQYVSVRFGGITSSGVKFDIGTSSAVTGTSSALVSGATSATSSAAGYIAYGSTGALTFSQNIINTGEYLNVVTYSLATTTGGYCQAEFTQF